ncbi:hypothetical protein UA38_11745 [Photobacterium kishitanii]|uniref:Uncharacterized protein n=1 Tax=Photobacterium kishitanii TaxID=318456 RepID=A0AAX0YV93_9GAMM|nr:hypothetical protein [Photobacterium kishitanii]KJG57041.1 hypothetical protein UA38_11745 [Photobacterium kishitanii]KJG60565.1 hypothetical protein UA42_14530 [Photobacterium kishitanii]KJG64867.1 hypothetical protein UA40_14225 [Photobacterium kishitanii]KJG68504.1 hypothetical protein UA41_16640 [Photobacterium kishitanii]OBU31212.1 hypothetical protein AYY23_20075 [Photobacterium kishitanii]
MKTIHIWLKILFRFFAVILTLIVVALIASNETINEGLMAKKSLLVYWRYMIFVLVIAMVFLMKNFNKQQKLWLLLMMSIVFAMTEYSISGATI